MNYKFQDKPERRIPYQKPGTYDKVNYINATIPDDVVDSLFAAASDGNIDKVKNMVIQQQLPLNVKNKNGLTLVNHILAIETISDIDKFQFLDYLFRQNVSYDDNEISPLHFASKIQNIKLVEYLLKKKHNTKVLDSKQMTPLHYATFGKTGDCPVERIKKFIKYDKNDNPFKHMYTNLAKIIADILYILPKIGYEHPMTFISKLAKNTGKHFDHECKEVFDQFGPAIVSALHDSTSNQDVVVRNLLFSYVTESKDKITKDWTSLQPLNINVSNDNEWGPLTGSNFKLMKHNIHVNNMISNKLLYTNYYNIRLNNLLMELKSIIINQQTNITEDIFQYIYNIQTLYHFIFNTNDIINPLVHLNYLKYNFDINTNTFEQDNDIKLYKKINMIPKFYRCISSKIPDLARKFKKPEALFKIPLTREMFEKYEVGEQFYDYYFSLPEKTKHKYINNNFFSIKNINYNLYFNNILDFLLQQILRNIDDIKINEHIPSIQSNMNLICIKLVNMLHYIVHIKFELETRSKDSIDNFLVKISQLQYDDNIYLYITSLMIDDITSIQNILISFNLKLNDIYDNILKIWKLLNEHIYMYDQYMGLNIFYSFINKQQNITLLNIPDQKTKYLNELPDSLDKFYNEFHYETSYINITLNSHFVSLYNNEINYNKKRMWEKFIRRVDNTNYTTYYNSNENIEPLIGFLYFNDTNTFTNMGLNFTPMMTDNLDITHTSAIKTKYNKNNLGNFGKSISIYNLQHILLNSVIYSSTDIIYNYYKNIIIKQMLNLFGKLVLHQYGKHDFNNITKPSLTDVIDTTIFDNSDDKFTSYSTKLNSVIQTNRLSQFLVDKVTEYREYLSKFYNLPLAWDQILLITVGRITDSIITSLIDSTMTKSINQQIISYVQPTIPEKDITYLFEEDAVFNMNFNEVFDRLMQLFFTKSDNFTKLISSNYLQEKFKNDELKSFKMYNDDYLNIQSSKSTCYNYNSKIIEKLVKAGCPINKRDTTGCSPIFYAINMYNVDMVKIILPNEAFVTNIHNNNGLTPLFYALKQLKYHTDLLYEKNNLLKFPKLFAQKVIETNSSKIKKYDDMVPLFLNNVFAMLLMIYNYKIYKSMQLYENNWSYENEKQLESLSNIISNTKFPFIEKNNIETSLKNYNASYKYIESYQKSFNKTKKKVKQLQIQYESLKKTFSLLNTQLVDIYNETVNIINKLIQKYNKFAIKTESIYSSTCNNT